MRKLVFILVFLTGIANAQIVNIPDANFKAKLLEANISNGYAQNFTGNFMVIDANSDGEIQNSEALAVRTLNVNYFSISDLTGVEAFSNLEELSCLQNQISFLNISSLINLKSLRCSNNNISNLSISGLIQLETLECHSNQMSTINLNGAVNLKSLTCYNNLLSSLNVSQNTLLEFIWSDTNQLTDLNLNGLSNLISIICTNNQLTTLDLSGLTNLVRLECANNQLTTLDISPLVNLQALYCDGNQLTSLDLSNQNITELGCSNNLFTNLDLSNLTNLGALIFGNPGLNPVDLSGFNLSLLNFYGGNQTTIDISNSTSLFNLFFQNTNLTTIDCSNNPIILGFGLNNNINLNYLNIKNGGSIIGQINNCPNLSYVCANESDIIDIYGYIQSGTNNNPNTVVNSYCSFTPGGNYNTITGLIIFDENNNGCDVSDAPHPNIKVNINDGNNQGATYTNYTGNYTFYTQAGSFDLTPSIENPIFFNFSPFVATIPFANNNNNTATQNFCITANGIHPDVEIVIAPITPARPGFDAKYQIVYKNKGNQTLSGNITFTYNDEVLDFVNATVVPDTQNTGLLNWNYTNLLPFENRSIYITLNVNAPTETPVVNIGDILNFEAIITPVIADEIPADNLFTYNQTVVGSYDPNNIECLEGDIVPPIEIGEYLHYIINFENTGTAPAENVVVKTIIDATKFDVNTLQIMNTSHNAYTKQTGNVVEFIFENLNLDSGGHGNVLLKVKTKNNLVVGDMVAKRADIFFDYNAPIDTGFANTTFQALSNPSFETDNSINVYPNPSASIVNINGNFNIKSVELYDVQGRLLQTIVNDGASVALDISSHQAGIYFIKATSDKGIKVEKIVKE